ncbi:ABC transporter permease [Mycolicibacterium austroafricanum]|jgi:phospholipid/cholesterol/gamma-HCH transport system permease protein|uniref:ABC transporter permease n=1 Tax=Mycolicibacterium austroafricanum TaxID=39687 RepID=UPI00055DE603|nr:ABC transporter permease [Mycolicibacterium austroafricanum]QZY47043.1 ABC transporter permease [Mycolicibacterium austroafricanum]
MTATAVRQRFPRVLSRATGIRGGLQQIGEQARFYGLTLRSIVDVAVHYKAELLRQIAIMSLGTGALAMIGGTVVVITFLNISTGAIVAAQGFNQFSELGVEALTGFGSAFLFTRLIGLGTAVIAFSATLGAGATAQLGAMRINEEIDALEVMGIRSVAYLASTRVAAGVIVVVPLYCVSLLMGYFAARFGTTVLYGQSTGVYDHYFRTFLIPGDVVNSFITVIVLCIVVMLIHTYYGFNASGGPAGVGRAVGQATRTSLVAAGFVILFVTLALYGQTGNFNFSG